MVQLDVYLNTLLCALQERFGKRLIYVGLQGSYLRGEATEHSDIDVMAVIDTLSAKDLDTYKESLISVGEYEKSCGFLCGKDELSNWNPLEICHLLHTTKDYYGKLNALVPAYTAEDERNFVKLSLNNLFHELCHGYIHSDRATNIERLPYIYKSVFFLLQNMHYLASGNFVTTKKDLLSKLAGKEQEVLETAMMIAGKREYEFGQAFRILFDWCQQAIIRI
jgi:predicted nucleotidyltransferase